MTLEIDEKELKSSQLMKIDKLSLINMDLKERQKAEALYYQLGLDPIVSKVLTDYPEMLSGMDRVTEKILGAYDVKGRADAVAKVTALVTYAAMSEHFSKKVGEMNGEITKLSEERDHVRSNYEGLVEKVADVVGGDYQELKSNYQVLIDRLNQVENLNKQVGEQKKERAILKKDYESEVKKLKWANETLSLENSNIWETIRQLKDSLPERIDCKEMSEQMVVELNEFLLKDSKVPKMVMEGVGKFIDFKKYLGLAVEKGAKEAVSRVIGLLDKLSK